jgi:primosomal protein N' (replication factor Y) (superfamily II helicase)
MPPGSASAAPQITPPAAPEPAPDAAAGLVEVVLGAGPPMALTYRLEGAQVAPGTRVRVPLGRRSAVGFVVGPAARAPEGKALKGARPMEETPAVTAEVLALARRVAEYYLCPLGAVLAAAVPPSAGTRPVAGLAVRVAALAVDAGAALTAAAALEARAPRQAEALRRLAVEGEIPAARLPAGTAARLAARGLVALRDEGVGRAPLQGREAPPAGPPVRLTAAQAAALERVEAALSGERFETLLLHGVTGSGKTEVYLRAAERVVARGRQVLLLTPEIALASHLTLAARARFGPGVALLHSGLSDGERRDEWARVRADAPANAGGVALVIGTRSAVFAPLARLGLIVVDEEHDGAYKQEESPRYHARDVALMRAQALGVPVLLGSATPSLESFARARDGHAVYLELPERIETRPLPKVALVDLRDIPPVRKGGVITAPLRDALAETLARGEQALLFLNRRGFAPLVLCPACGHTYRCRHCEVTLTFHRGARSFLCHFCGDRRPAADACDACGNPLLLPMGVGTEGLVEEVKALLPDARVLRMDRDTTRAKHAHLDILAEVAKGAADVLVGTQMIAKGHDLPGVTLVGVVCADQGVHVPDFRAAETAFALLTQVAGRAGRGDRPGRVILQTYSPEHPAIRHAVDHDYAAFAAEELVVRRAVGYPPAGRVVRMVLWAREPAQLDLAGERLRALVQARRPAGVEVLGPAPPALGRLRGLHRRHLLVKGRSVGPVRQVARWLLDATGADPAFKGVRVDVDVDPQALV